MLTKLYTKISTGIALMLFSAAALASKGDPMPWDGPIDKIVNALTGTTATLVTVAAIVIAGFIYMKSEGGGSTGLIFKIVIGASLAKFAGDIAKLLGFAGFML